MSTALRTRLMGVMAREMSALRFQPSSYCEGQFKKMVGQGITRMRINKADNHPSHLNRAEQSMKSMVKYFCDYSRRVGSYPTLSDTEFDSALKDCPSLWPFRS